MRRDSEPKVTDLRPDQIAVLNPKRGGLTPRELIKTLKQFRNELLNPGDTVATPSATILETPTAEIPTPQSFNPLPLSKEEPEHVPARTPDRLKRTRRNTNSPTEHRRPINRGRNRFRMQEHVLYAVASVLILAGANAQRDQIMKTAESAAQRVVDGMTNPPGLQVARERYLENQSYINYEKQLKARREAVKVDSEAKRASLDRRQIKDQIEFLITFAEGIDKTHGNNSAGDSHRLEAARLQALLDR